MSAQEHEQQRRSEKASGMVEQVGPLEVDWPRTVGYFSGIGLAVAFGMVEPPLALFIAAVPLFKMLNQPNAPRAMRLVSEVLDGASTPVGGDARSMIWFKGKRPEGGIVHDARRLADRRRARRQTMSRPAEA